MRLYLWGNVQTYCVAKISPCFTNFSIYYVTQEYFIANRNGIHSHLKNKHPGIIGYDRWNDQLEVYNTTSLTILFLMTFSRTIFSCHPNKYCLIFPLFHCKWYCYILFSIAIASDVVLHAMLYPECIQRMPEISQGRQYSKRFSYNN